MPPESGSAQPGQSPAPFEPLPGCDVGNSINDLWFRLGFMNADDMAVDDRWVTLAELFQFADDAVKMLSRGTALFLDYDDSIDVAAATATYALPAGWVFTEAAWLLYAGYPLQLLRLTTIGQLFALDAQWSATTGNPSRLSLDAAGVGNGVLYPAPIASSTLAEVLGICPPTVAAGASALPVCSLLQDYLSDAMLRAARGKESDAAMPEVAAHMKERMGLYETAIAHLWGRG